MRAITLFSAVFSSNFVHSSAIYSRVHIQKEVCNPIIFYIRRKIISTMQWGNYLENGHCSFQMCGDFILFFFFIFCFFFEIETGSVWTKQTTIHVYIYLT